MKRMILAALLALALGSVNGSEVRAEGFRFSFNLGCSLGSWHKSCYYDNHPCSPCGPIGFPPLPYAPVPAFFPPGPPLCPGIQGYLVPDGYPIVGGYADPALGLKAFFGHGYGYGYGSDH